MVKPFVSCHVSAVPSSRMSLLSVSLALPSSLPSGELLAETRVPARGGSRCPGRVLELFFSDVCTRSSRMNQSQQSDRKAGCQAE